MTLRRFVHYDDQVQVDDDYCTVGFAGGEPVRVSLLSPAKHLDLLNVAGERFGSNSNLIAPIESASNLAPRTAKRHAREEDA